MLLGWGNKTDSLVKPFVIVIVDECSNHLLCLQWVLQFFPVEFLVLDGFDPTLDKAVVLRSLVAGKLLSDAQIVEELLDALGLRLGAPIAGGAILSQLGIMTK